MNLLKSIFIILYMMLILIALTFYAFHRLGMDGYSPAWLGVAITTVLPLMVLMPMMLFKNRARTNAHLPVILFFVIDGAILTLFTADTPEPALYALISLAGFLLYNFWYSKLDRAANPQLAVGQNLPDFSLEDLAGEPVTAQNQLGHKTLWLFYRGNWCPLCMAQIKEIAAEYRDLADRGVEILLISPQPPGHTRGLAQKFNVPFKFLVDPDNQAARQLHLDAQHGVPMGMQMLGYDSETVLPTVIITNEEGRIIFIDETDNYRVRPEPATFLRTLDKAV